MARMNRRGQTLLVGAISLAVLFVTLALVLNTAIYGSSLASQATGDVRGGTTIAIQHGVESDVEYFVADAVDSSTGYSTQRTQVAAAVDDVSDDYQRFYARSDRIVEVRVSGPVEGTLVERQTDGQFTSLGDVQDANIRAFTIDVQSLSGSSPLFTMEFENQTSVWTVTLSESPSGSTTVDLVEPDATTESCTVGDSSPRVDVTGGTINGDYCPALDFFERIQGHYDVHFQNEGEIQGTYSLVTNDTSATGDITQQSIYATEVGLSITGLDTNYTTTVQAAPGEPA